MTESHVNVCRWRVEAEQLLVRIKACAAKQEQSRHYGPAACRSEQVDAILRLVERVQQERAAKRGASCAICGGTGFFPPAREERHAFSPDAPQHGWERQEGGS